MDSLFSGTLDTVAPLRLRKIKEKSHCGIMSGITLWYNENTHTLKRAAWKFERSWRKTSQVTYVTMVPQMGNETLRPLGVATGNALSVTRV